MRRIVSPGCVTQSTLADGLPKFTTNRDIPRNTFNHGTTPADIALIKAMGFDHVRLGVNPQPICSPLSGRSEKSLLNTLARLTPRCR